MFTEVFIVWEFGNDFHSNITLVQKGKLHLHLEHLFFLLIFFPSHKEIILDPYGFNSEI